MAFGSMTEDGSMMALGSGWTLLPFARALRPFSWHGEQAPQWLKVQSVDHGDGREADRANDEDGLHQILLSVACG